MAFRDGSFKDEWETEVLIVEGGKHNQHIISATSTTLAHNKDQEDYRINTARICNIIIIIEEICLNQGIYKGSITVACYGIKVLKKAMDSDTHYYFLSNNFDIIYPIGNNLQEIPL